MGTLLIIVRRLLVAAWRYRWSAVAVSWLVCGAGWAGVYLIPNQYEASARLYVDADEGELEPHMTAVAAAHPRVRIGSYPRFSERSFRVLITLEGPEHADVAAAHADLAGRLGAKVVKRDEPARVA